MYVRTHYKPKHHLIRLHPRLKRHIIRHIQLSSIINIHTSLLRGQLVRLARGRRPLRGIYGLLLLLLLVLILGLIGHVNRAGAGVRCVLLHIGIVRLVLRILRRQLLLAVSHWLLLLLLLLGVHLGLGLTGVLLLLLLLAQEGVRLRVIHSQSGPGGARDTCPRRRDGLLGVDGLVGGEGEAEDVGDVGEGGDEEQHVDGADGGVAAEPVEGGVARDAGALVDDAAGVAVDGAAVAVAARHRDGDGEAAPVGRQRAHRREPEDDHQPVQRQHRPRVVEVPRGRQLLRDQLVGAYDPGED